MDKKPINLSFFTGSVTPNSGNNPSFSLITFDYETSLPLNIETHYLDLEEANTLLRTNWKKRHDYLSLYKLKDLSPSSMNELA